MGVRQFGTKGAHATPNFKPPYEGAIFCSVRLDAQDLGLDQRFTFALNDILSIPASNLEFADIPYDYSTAKQWTLLLVSKSCRLMADML